MRILSALKRELRGLVVLLMTTYIRRTAPKGRN